MELVPAVSVGTTYLSNLCMIAQMCKWEQRISGVQSLVLLASIVVHWEEVTAACIVTHSSAVVVGDWDTGTQGDT